MLTRLQVDGFKNLVGVDVRFGPFTCIAGENGVGKSNLFDVIQFLSALSERSLTEAAATVRRARHGAGDALSLFRRIGGQPTARMKLAAEMVVPREAVDHLGQRATAAATWLRYELQLGFEHASSASSGGLRVVSESLAPIPKSELEHGLLFEFSPAWGKSALRFRKQSNPLISTEDEKDRGSFVGLHQEGRQGRRRKFEASSLPRTVLSDVSADEFPTALCARREMSSWRLLQLEPSALRSPDDPNSERTIGADGSHLPATLARLCGVYPDGAIDANRRDSVLADLSNRLRELVPNVREVQVDFDKERKLYKLKVVDEARTEHAAQSLSDGTLRFLALAVLQMDPDSSGLICFEEPENGMHPGRVEAMVTLLRDLAVDTSVAIGEGNPPRQVIVNTHSPLVAGLVDDDSLLYARSTRKFARGPAAATTAEFAALGGTWRTVSGGNPTIAPGDAKRYLRPFDYNNYEGPVDAGRNRRRVIDRRDLKPRRDLTGKLPFGEAVAEG